MKNIILIIIVLAGYNQLIAQNYYSKTYDPFGHHEENIRNIIIEDSIIYASCRGTNQGNVIECFKFGQFDLEGNFKDGYEDLRFETGHGFEHDGEYLYVDGGNEPYNTKLIAARIHKLTKESKLLEFTKDSSELVINEGCISNIKHLITFGTFRNSSDLIDGTPSVKSILKWIDKNTFSLDTTIIIPVRKKFTAIDDAASDAAGNIYFICIEKLDKNGFEGNFVRIVKYSPNGELLWDYDYDVAVNGAKPLNIKVIGNKIIFQAINENRNETLFCIDEYGTLFWKYTIDNERTIKDISVNRITISNDGNVLLCGRQRSPFHKWIDTGFLMKLDIETGKLIWERIYEIDLGNDPIYSNGNAKGSSLWGLSQLPNGDIIAGGWVQNIFEDPIKGLRHDQDLWLIRVDSLGCLEPGCGLVQSIQNGIVQKDSCKWLEDRPTWYYTPWSPEKRETLHKIEVVRDTTLGNRVCSVLSVTEDGRYVPESELIVFYEWQREEVYFYEDEKWKKLFDFSWSVGPGDTVEFYLPQNFMYYDISSSKGSFTPSKKPYYYRVRNFEWRKINGINYKTQQILHIPNEDGECFDMADVTEGIGSKKGFLGRSCTQLTLGFEEYFRCFSSKQVAYIDLESCTPGGIHKFSLGAKWTYELTCQIPNEVSFITYEITDTFSYKDMACYVINEVDSICTLGNKVFGIDHRLTDSLQLLFDFDEADYFPFECFEINSGIENYHIGITSKGQEQISDGQILDVTQVETFCYYGYWGDIEEKVYDGIGANSVAPFPCKNFCNNLSDPVFCQVGKLRCFENGQEYYQLVEYSCDSVWVLTNTVDVISESISIFPNPATDQLTIQIQQEGIAQRVVVRNITGKVLFDQQIQDHDQIDITDWIDGLYFIEFWDKEDRVTYREKVVVIR